MTGYGLGETPALKGASWLTPCKGGAVLGSGVVMKGPKELGTGTPAPGGESYQVTGLGWGMITGEVKDPTHRCLMLPWAWEKPTALPPQGKSPIIQTG